jgi:hypothetical protein
MVKYIDNMNGETRDYLSKKEWDAEKDYGNEYVRVYFRINTPTYSSNCGFETIEDRDAWCKEATKLIKNLGIMEDCGYTVEHSKDNQAYLYAHPQDISGVVKKNDVKRIAEAIESFPLSALRWIDLYETIYVISDSDYNDYLIGKQEQIRKLLFAYSATPRTNKFACLNSVAVAVAKRVKLHRLGICEGYSGQTVDFVKAEADKMVKEGFLVKAIIDDCEYIRSINKTEQKVKKLYM